MFYFYIGLFSGIAVAIYWITIVALILWHFGVYLVKIMLKVIKWASNNLNIIIPMFIMYPFVLAMHIKALTFLYNVPNLKSTVANNLTKIFVYSAQFSYAVIILILLIAELDDKKDKKDSKDLAKIILFIICLGAPLAVLKSVMASTLTFLTIDIWISYEITIVFQNMTKLPMFAKPNDVDATLIGALATIIAGFIGLL